MKLDYIYAKNGTFVGWTFSGCHYRVDLNA